jgi:phosphoglycerate dehydrogenase-like enzyme
MNTIILTSDFSQGLKLKEKIADIEGNLRSLQNFTKKCVINSPEKFIKVKYIISTWYMPTFSEDEIRKYLPSLKSIFYAAGTTKYFESQFLGLNIEIFSAEKCNSIPVAEFVVSQIILANKGYFQAHKEYHKPFWKFSFNKGRKITNNKYGNYFSHIGIIGCGEIGSLVIKLLKQYDVKISVYDPYISPDKLDKLGCFSKDLKSIFSECDVISCHLPDNFNTKKLINYKYLSLLKDHATIINTGRGAQINEKDLVKVMRRKRNACALLDVTYPEPVRPWSKLLRTKNIFLSPHIAGSLCFEIDRMVKYILSEYSKVKHNELKN